MPRVVSLYIRHCVIGFVLAAVFTAALIGFDIGHLRHLVSHAEDGWLAVMLLWAFNGMVFSGVQFGIAVMGMAPGDDAPGGALPEPATVPARAR